MWRRFAGVKDGDFELLGVSRCVVRRCVWLKPRSEVVGVEHGKFKALKFCFEYLELEQNQAAASVRKNVALSSIIQKCVGRRDLL